MAGSGVVTLTRAGPPHSHRTSPSSVTVAKQFQNSIFACSIAHWLSRPMRLPPLASPLSLARDGGASHCHHCPRGVHVCPLFPVYGVGREII